MVPMGLILRVLVALVLSVFFFDAGPVWAALVLFALAALAVVAFWPVIRRLLFPHP